MNHPLRVDRLGLVLATALIAWGPELGAQSAPDWDVMQPRGRTRVIDFTTDEGTWMSVDLSPDGQWIIFDLLGHIYRVSATGGEAQALTQESGIAVNYHARYSPDGKEIVFGSDRGGQDNLWVMNADGSSPRPVLLDDETRFVEPAWSPDGRYIAVTRRFKTGTAFYQMNDYIWLFPRQGGKGSELVRLPGMRAQWPSFSPDGRYLFFQTVRPDSRQLRRLDLSTGRIDDVTESKFRYNACCGRPAFPLRLGEAAPEPSPDGRWLAFARKIPGAAIRYRDKEYVGRTALWLRDLRTGKDRVLMDPITPDAMDFIVNHKLRVLPGYAWARDSKSIVLSQGGKLRRVWLESGRVETIPFTARVRRTISEQARNTHRISGPDFEAKSARWPASAPDGSQLVFEAAGRLWLKRLPNGEPRPLTAAEPEGFEMTPAWSADGRWIAYATWQDSVGGHVWKVRPDGTGRERLTRDPGTFLFPSWSGDGAGLVVNRWPPALMRPNPTWYGWELVRIPSAGGDLEPITPPGPLVRAGFGAGGRIYFAEHRGEGPSSSPYVADDAIQYLARGVPVPPSHEALVSIDPRGGDPRDHLTVPAWPKDIMPSPDGRWVAIQKMQDLYVGPMPPAASGARTIEVDIDQPSMRRLSRHGGFNPRWRNAGTLEFVAGSRYFAHHIETGRTDTVPLGLRLPRAYPAGTIALTGARLITLDNRRVVERGTVVVTNGRIACVGECDTRGASRVIDAIGKTIIPGWVDVHSHYLGTEPEADGFVVIPQHRSSSARYLAYGVTTTQDPGVFWAEPSFAIGEMVESGAMTGPRAFSGGEFLRCAAAAPFSNDLREIRSYADAEEHVNRLADRGAISLKSFQQCTRTQRQMLAEASRRRGLTISGEAQDLSFVLGLVMDGHTGWEHWLQYVPIFGDVAKFFGLAKAHYSAQLYVGDYPGGVAFEYWAGEHDLWADDKVREWSPWQETAARRLFVRKPLREYSFPILAEGAKDIVHEGGYLAIGAHAEQEGLDTHWEVWSAALALTPMEALESASLHGAHFIGLEQDIGSLAVGKLADLMILNSNPLDDIRNTADIAYTMKAGTLYDARTLAELWPRQRPYGPRPWRNEDALRTDVRAADYWDRKEP